MERVTAALRHEWSQISTKIGVVLTAVSTVAPQYAQFDVRWAHAGAIAGVLLILWREKTSG